MSSKFKNVGTNEELGKLIKSRCNIDENDCWLWKTAPSVNSRGYLVWNGKQDYRYRHSYRAFKGDINPNNLVCHRCDKPACCNPEHLWQGTDKENSQDMVSKRRQSRPWLGKTFSDTHRQNISLANKGKKHTDEAKKNMSIAKIGKKLSDEAKEERRRKMITRNGIS